jgi:four helix bundle protein
MIAGSALSKAATVMFQARCALGAWHAVCSNGDMTPDAFKARTRSFAIGVIRVVRKLPPTLVCRTIGAQLVKSGASTAANYRAACRGRSRAEFIAKLGIVEEEADESAFWLDLLVESGEEVPVAALRDLEDEAGQIVAMVVSSIRTARQRPR